MGSSFSNSQTIEHFDENSLYCESFFNPKKQEASKLLAKYKTTKDCKDIEKAFRLDNTNPEICYTFLCYLKENNKNEYHIIYPYVRFFLLQEQIKELEKEDPFSVKTSKEYLNDILDRKLKESEIPKLSNPYYLQFEKKEKNCYYFIDHFVEPPSIIMTSFDISPSFPLLSSNENHVYNYYLGELSLLSFSNKDTEFLTDIFNVLKALRDKISPFKLCRLLITFLINPIYIDSIACCQKLLYQYSINSITLTFCDKNDEELNSVIKKNIKFDKYLKEISELLWKILEPILQSKCISSLLSFIMKKQITIDKSVLVFIKESIQYEGLFISDLFGSTEAAFLKIYINTMQRTINETNCSKNFNLLFHFGSWIVTLLHEIVGHFSRRFFFYNSNKDYGNSFTPRDQSIGDDGGNYVEYLLFRSQKSLHISHIVYLLEIKNWDVEYSEFAKSFSNIKDESEVLVRAFLKKEYTSSNSIIKQILVIGGREKEEYENLIKIAHVHPSIKITKLTRSSIVVDSEDKDRQKTKSRIFYLNKWCKRQYY